MDWIRNRLTQFAERTAFYSGDSALSYASLTQRIDSLIDYLQTDLGTGNQVIAVEEANPADNLAAVIALSSLGKTILPISPQSPEKEKQYRIGRVEWTLHNRKLRRKTASAEPHPLLNKLGQSGHPGLILFSSGSTGSPKAMLHDLKLLLDRYESLAARSDRTLQLLPLDHIGGLDAALRTLCSGSAIVIPEARTPESAGHAIAKHQVSVLPASPTFLNLMLLTGVAHSSDLSSLRVIAYGAEPMPFSLLQKLKAAFPEVDLQQKFGTSETGAIRIKSAGSGKLNFSIKDKDADWKIVDGELWLQSSSRILGYLNSDADNSSLLLDGWFRTGDLIEEDKDGSLRIIGRRADLINVGGEKVAPIEVESILMEMPAIADCLVYAEENAITGQIVVAQIVPQGEYETVQLKRAIKKHCRKRLATYKIPARIQITEKTKYSDRLKKLRSQ